MNLEFGMNDEAHLRGSHLVTVFHGDIRHITKKECIPVWCVLPTSSATTRCQFWEVGTPEDHNRRPCSTRRPVQEGHFLPEGHVQPEGQYKKATFYQKGTFNQKTMTEGHFQPEGQYTEGHFHTRRALSTRRSPPWQTPLKANPHQKEHGTRKPDRKWHHTPKCTSFHHMLLVAVLKWTSLSRSPVLTIRCHYQGVRAGGSQVWCPWGAGAGGHLYSEVQGIMGNGHMGTPWTERQEWESITFPQVRWQPELVMAACNNMDFFSLNIFLIKFLIYKKAFQ